MLNETIAEHFSLLSKLMDIHGDNSFKSKSYANAAFQVDKLPQQLIEMNKKIRFNLHLVLIFLSFFVFSCSSQKTIKNENSQRIYASYQNIDSHIKLKIVNQ